MCLDIIHRKKPKPSGWAWKVFKSIEGIYFFTDYQLDGRPKRFNTIDWKAEVLRKKWMKARVKMIDTYPKYMTGFHLYVQKRNPWHPSGVAVRVRYRGGRILGSQENRKIIIADEIYVP